MVSHETSMDMPSIGSMTVPQVQSILREHQKYRVALEQILCIVGDKSPAGQIIKAVLAHN